MLGDLQMGLGLSVDSISSLGSDLSVYGTTSLGATLSVTSDASLGSNLSVHKFILEEGCSEYVKFAREYKDKSIVESKGTQNKWHCALLAAMAESISWLEKEIFNLFASKKVVHLFDIPSLGFYEITM